MREASRCGVLSSNTRSREVFVRFVSPAAALLTVATLVACASNTARQYGEYTAIAPRVSGVPNERAPLHVNVELARPANVAVFLVVPGRGATLLYPSDSGTATYVEAGTHQLATSLSKQARDSTMRRGPLATAVGPQANPQGRGRRQTGGRDTMMAGPVLGARGYLLVFASQEPMAFRTLENRVGGVSIPIEDNEALNTVTKLIKATLRGSGP